MWKNQKGFSLIEIIILIAMIGILAGSSVAIFGHIPYANTRKVAEEVDAALSRLRLETMSQSGEQRLYICKLDDGYYLKSDPTDSGTRLCGNNVTINPSLKGTHFTIQDDKYVCVAYKKSGVFREIDTNADCIEISGSGTYTIRLDLDTGRHYFE